MLQYSCDVNRLGAELAPLFVQLSASEKTLEFLVAHPPHSLPAALARSFAGMFWYARARADVYACIITRHVQVCAGVCTSIMRNMPVLATKKEVPYRCRAGDTMLVSSASVYCMSCTAPRQLDHETDRVHCLWWDVICCPCPCVFGRMVLLKHRRQCCTRHVQVCVCKCVCVWCVHQ